MCETISSKIRDYMDPLPDVEMIPHRIDDMDVLQLKVKAGNYTPYYYVGDAPDGNAKRKVMPSMTLSLRATYFYCFARP